MSMANGPVLYDSAKSVHHFFEDKTEFTIGRNADSCLDIASKYISRNQCVIKLKEEKEWFIKDVSSFKTTRVNNQPIVDEWQLLKEGDKISFHYFSDGEFIFFHGSVPSNSVRKKRKLVKMEDIVCLDSEEEISLEIDRNAEKIIELKATISSLEIEKDRIAEENKIMNEKYLQVSKILEETQKSLENVENEKTNLGLKLIDEKAVKEDVILQMQNYIDQLKECELELERVIKEKNSNKDITNTPSCSTDQAELLGNQTPVFDLDTLFDELEFKSVKEELEIVHKNLQVREGELNEVLAERDLLFANVSDLIEQEYTCSVCSELLFQATSLQCRHTFCAKCLATWKLNKKECPICRTRIKSEVVSLVIDSFIDKLTELIGGELKKRRDDVRAERISTNPRGVGVSPFRFNHNRRGQRRSGGRSRRTNRAAEYEITISELQRLMDRDTVLIDLT